MTTDELDEEELEATAHAKYEWDCPSCGDVQEVEHDPAGETLECDCGAMVRIRETM